MQAVHLHAEDNQRHIWSSDSAELGNNPSGEQDVQTAELSLEILGQVRFYPNEYLDDLIRSSNSQVAHPEGLALEFPTNDTGTNWPKFWKRAYIQTTGAHQDAEATGSAALRRKVLGGHFDGVPCTCPPPVGRQRGPTCVSLGMDLSPPLVEKNQTSQSRNEYRTFFLNLISPCSVQLSCKSSGRCMVFKSLNHSMYKVYYVFIGTFVNTLYILACKHMH